MREILAKLLQNRGVKSFDELDSSKTLDGSPSEKDTYMAWEQILSKEDVTLKDLEIFCKNQIDVIEGKWKDLNLDNSKKAEFIPYHTVYKTLFTVINAPRSERELLEKHLNNLLK